VLLCFEKTLLLYVDITRLDLTLQCTFYIDISDWHIPQISCCIIWTAGGEFGLKADHLLPLLLFTCVVIISYYLIDFFIRRSNLCLSQHDSFCVLRSECIFSKWLLRVHCFQHRL